MTNLRSSLVAVRKQYGRKNTALTKESLGILFLYYCKANFNVVDATQTEAIKYNSNPLKLKDEYWLGNNKSLLDIFRFTIFSFAILCTIDNFLTKNRKLIIFLSL